MIRGSRYRLEVEIGSESPYASAGTAQNSLSKNGVIHLGILLNDENISEIIIHETLHIVIDRMELQEAKESKEIYYFMDYAECETLNYLLMDRLEFRDVECIIDAIRTDLILNPHSNPFL